MTDLLIGMGLIIGTMITATGLTLFAWSLGVPFWSAAPVCVILAGLFTIMASRL